MPAAATSPTTTRPRLIPALRTARTETWCGRFSAFVGRGGVLRARSYLQVLGTGPVTLSSSRVRFRWSQASLVLPVRLSTFGSRVNRKSHPVSTPLPAVPALICAPGRT